MDNSNLREYVCLQFWNGFTFGAFAGILATMAGALVFAWIVRAE